jgi:hypothetical protein
LLGGTVFRCSFHAMATRTNAVGDSIKRLQELGVNFLAIDFDLTILDVHTGGRWSGTLDELLGHVRHEFRQLIVAARQNGIRVAVVTFTSQVVFVKGVLEAILGPEEAAWIPIRGNDRSWSYQGAGCRDGKQAHIASAVEELENAGQADITKTTTVLIDDDRRNVHHALADGVRAIWFNPDKPHHLLQDLARLV